MAVVYVTLIVEGTVSPKTNESYKFADVTKVIQPKVKGVLDASACLN